MAAKATLKPTGSAALYSLGTPFVSWRHKILAHSAYGNALRNFARRNGLVGWRDLFIYFHVLRCTFVIAMWIVRPGTGNGPGCMKELEVLDGHPDREVWEMEDGSTRPARLPRVDYIYERLRPSYEVFDEAVERARDEKRAFLEKRLWEEAETKSYARFLRKKLGPNDPTGTLIEQGIIPFVPDALLGLDARDRELADRLKDRKVISEMR